jgi:CRISPR-associated protein Cas2
MIVLQLTDCPQNLRGDLTKWLLEISAGVFVGQVSARVRDSLWTRVEEARCGGRVVMVYSTNNEQRLDFRVAGDTWEPIDFDGIKLMLRPSPSRLKARQSVFEAKRGFSDAAKRRAAQKFSAARVRYPTNYVVIDIETTGLNPEKDEIIEIGALKIIDGKIIDKFYALIKTDKPVPQNITELTGITDELAASDGKPLKSVLGDFLRFLGDMAIVAHNIDFDNRFLREACFKCEYAPIANRLVDTLALSRRLVKGLPSYKLSAMTTHFGIERGEAHRSLADCEMTRQLYSKLMNLMEDGS